jgi:hypothetical protein
LFEAALLDIAPGSGSGCYSVIKKFFKIRFVVSRTHAILRCSAPNSSLVSDFFLKLQDFFSGCLLPFFTPDPDPGAMSRSAASNKTRPKPYQFFLCCVLCLS